MVVQYELFRHDLTTLGLNAAGSGLIAKAGTLFVRRKGATLTVAMAGTGTETLTVSDIGTITIGDSIKANGQGPTALVNGVAYTRTTINVTWSGAASQVGVGTRLTVAAPNASVPAEVDAYSEPFQTLSKVTQPIAFGAVTGLVSIYTRAREVDFIRTVDSIVTVVPDQAGSGGRDSFSPRDFDAVFDGAVDDSAAFAASVALLSARGGGVLELPPGTAALGSTFGLTSLTGVVVRGQGKSLTTLEFTGASQQILLASCTDVTFENITIGRAVAGAALLVAISSGNTRVTFRNVHFTDGAGICLDQGVDTVFDNCSADGASWTSGFLLLNATRTKIKDFVGRPANNMTAPFLDIDQDTKSPRFTNWDVAPSAVATFSLPGIRIRSTGGAATGPTDVVFNATKVVAGNFGTAQPCVEILTPSGAGDEPTGITFNDTQCEDSERAFDCTGGLGVKLNGVRSVQMDNECIYLRAGVQHYTLSNIESSHVGSLLPHVRVDGAAQDLSIENIRGGNFLRTGGVVADSVVRLEDGTGERIWVTRVQRASTASANQAVRSDKINTRNEIHLFHNMASASAAVSPLHEGFGALVRAYINDETTIDCESVSVITINYGVAKTVLTTKGMSIGQRVTITNVGGNAVTLKHQNTGLGSDFNFAAALDLVLSPDESVVVELSSKATQGLMEIANPTVV